MTDLHVDLESLLHQLQKAHLKRPEALPSVWCCVMPHGSPAPGPPKDYRAQDQLVVVSHWGDRPPPTHIFGLWQKQVNCRRGNRTTLSAAPR